MATEKRLIDACALNRNIDCCDFESSQDYMTICEQIIQAPTVEAVELVHGQWIIEYWKSGYIKRGYCSICGETPKDPYRPDNYCRGCGAKMDGVKNAGS